MKDDTFIKGYTSGHFILYKRSAYKPIYSVGLDTAFTALGFPFFWHVFKEIVRLLFMHCSWIVATLFDFSTIFSPLVGPVNSARDLQISFLATFFIKNGSHGTIHTFKNYFAIVFLIFSFQFKQNKFYPNDAIFNARLATVHVYHSRMKAIHSYMYVYQNQKQPAMLIIKL